MMDAFDYNDMQEMQQHTLMLENEYFQRFENYMQDKTRFNQQLEKVTMRLFNAKANESMEYLKKMKFTNLEEKIYG